ncbi:hypothetical protein Tco_1537436, partial [Tanacetum coccineum]
FNDHVVSNLNRKRNEEVENGFVEEIKAGKEDLIEEIGKSDKEWYNGVFRSADKVNSTEAEPSVSMNKIDCEKECLSDNHAISSDKMCTDENEIVLEEVVTTCERSQVRVSPWGFPSRWKSVRFYPVDASIRGWQGLPSGYVLWNRITNYYSRLAGTTFWLLNVPLEAWIEKGLSVIASTLGKPFIMDVMTTNLCKYGREKVGYARILVEVSACRGFMVQIELECKC